MPRVGRVDETNDPVLPYRLLDRDGVEVVAVSEFLLNMLADDDSPAALRQNYYLDAAGRLCWRTADDGGLPPSSSASDEQVVLIG
ncbi:hypothetical protein [Kitasatospora sp. NPDC017646]|uniref:hypothetical protein n=1 Tax=Kitasatospora sp. NPDC017646 TaxID=3364024 RepID=UPI0037A61A68